MSGIRPLQGVAGLAGVCHGVPVSRVIVCHVTMGWGCRVSAVHWDTCGGRWLPHPDLCAGGVMRPQEVVTLGTLVVGDLPVARALKLCLPVGHVLGGLADDGPALGDGPAPVGLAGDGVQAVQLLLQLVAGVTVEGEDRALDQEVGGPPGDIAILDTGN